LLLRVAHERLVLQWIQPGAGKARKAPDFTRFMSLERAASALPMSLMRRHLFVKDVKVFLRDVSQWSQLLLLFCTGFWCISTTSACWISDGFPRWGGVVKNLYAFVNLGDGGDS